MRLSELAVLVVDDSKTMRRIIRKSLNELQFENITEAADGEEAWDILQGDGTCHIIVSDWFMPRMKGIDLLKKVRGNGTLGNTPFLMVTAEARKENLVEAVKEGVSGYITKPFTLDEMRDKLAKIMAKPTFADFLQDQPPVL